MSEDSMKRMAMVLMGALALGACARMQVTSVALEEKRVCIIENPRVKFDFIGAYRRALEERGFAVEVLPETASLTACPVTSRYIGYYRWDLVMYLASGEIQVFRGGQPAGRAVYTARSSRTSAEIVIRDMVAEIFKG